MPVVTMMPVSGVVEDLFASEEQQQVVTPAAGEGAAPVQNAGESNPDSATGDTETQKPEGERKGGFQRRIDKLTKEKSTAETEAAYWRDRALAGGAKPEQTAKPETKVAEPTATETPKPKADDFDTQAEYLDALTDWKLEQREAKATAARQQTEQKTQQETKVKTFKGRETTFADATPDYADVIQGAIADGVAMSPSLWDEVQDHEHGPALLYHLAKNPDEAARLSAMTPTQVARAVARLESRFVPQTPAAGESNDPPPLPVTNAPKPPTPTSGSTKTAAKDPGEMSHGEYMAWRKKNFPHL